MAALNIDPSTDSLNTLLRAGLSKNAVSEVIKVLYEFFDTREITEDVETYNMLLEAFVPLGYYNSRETICSLLELTESRDCIHDETTFSMLIDGLHKEKLEDAAQVILDMVDRDILLLDDRVYNFGIESLCKLGTSVEANALFEGLEGKDLIPDATTYRHIISAFSMDKDMRKVRRLFNDMNKKGVEPDKYSWETIMKSLAEVEDFETVLEAYKKCISKEWFLEWSYSPDSKNILKSLVNALVRSSKHNEISELLQMMRNEELTQLRYDIQNFEVESLCDIGKTAEARKFLERIPWEGLKLNAGIYGGIISAIAGDGNVGDVLALYYLMLEKGIEPYRYSYETILKCLFQVGDLENALQVCKHCIEKEWFEDYFLSSDASAMKSLLSLLTCFAKDPDTRSLVEMNEKSTSL